MHRRTTGPQTISLSIHGKPSYTLTVDELTTVCFKVKDPDLAILVGIEDFEQLSRSDVIRRALRAYAKQLGAEPADMKRVRTVQKARVRE